MADLSNMSSEDLIRRISSEDVPWLPYALIADTFFRVFQVDEVNNIVILNFKMPPWTVTPMHGHHCTATAYTLEGQWFYDELAFSKGDLAFETTVEIHQPVTRDQGAVLLTTLIGGPGNDALLENHNDDGSRTLLKTSFFKAFERISLEDYEKVDFAALI